MAIDSETVVQLVSTAGRLVGLQELLRVGGINPGEQTQLKRVLRELVKQGRLTRDGKRFGVPGEKPKQKSGPAWQGKSAKPALPRSTEGRKQFNEKQIDRVVSRSRGAPARTSSSGSGKQVKGIIHLHRDGFAFVKPIVGQDSEDLFIPPDEARKALDNDQVLVEVVPGRDGRTMGRVVEVQSRTRQMVIGTYLEDGRKAWVEPREKELGRIRVPPTQLARPGDSVKVKLGVGDSMFEGPQQLTGEVAGSLGSTADHSVEVLSVAFSKGFSDEFPPEVMDEADAIHVEVSEKEAKGEGRKDLRKLPLITIDGEDARDFDDAVYAEAHKDGTRLVVAIADVSHYVQLDTALDAEALRRATSVYLPGRVLPMLPERLSNGICSLKPDVDRLCMVADMVIDRAGVTVASEVYPGVMRSAARCTYTEVHDVLAGKHVPGRTELKAQFERLFQLSKTLNRMRIDRGAVDFDLPEQKVELGDDGLPKRLVKRERWESHRLVEECMLAANEAVARFFRESQLPTVNRFHGPPDDDRLEMFLTLLGAYGIAAPRGKFTSKSLNDVLKKLEGHPEQRALNQLALRSMAQAIYSSREAGHYGLGAEDYLHFTSPIRRYPDLLVHRLLKQLWARGKKRPSHHHLEEEEEQLEALAVQSSERERAAMQVEREVNQLYACLLLKDHLGEEHEGTVCGLSENGFFVQLDELLVEGFVKGETVSPDFEFDQATYRMVFGNGLTVKVGVKCRVLILSVNMERKQIDYQVTSIDGAEVDEPKRYRSQDRRNLPLPRGEGRPPRNRFEKQDRFRHENPPRGESRQREQARDPRKQRFERDDSGTTRRFEEPPRGEKSSRRFESKSSARAEPKGNRRSDDRGGRFEKPSRRMEPRGTARSFVQEKPRREAPPPQPWDRKKDDEERPQEERPKQGFDARAVLDRLWRERGGKR